MIVDAIVGVYNAEGSLIGELKYAVGVLSGTAHCALCDITHGRLREKRAFKATRARFALRTVHIDEQSADLAAHTAGHTPCVVARTADGWITLLDGASLEACDASVAAFEVALEAALVQKGLRLNACG